MLNTVKFVLGLPALLALACVPSLNAKTLEEVIVTAAKRPQPAQALPLSISALDGETLASMGINNTQDLATVIPSLVFTSRIQGAAPYIRGVGTKLALVGLESSVATYVDDQYYSRPIGSMLELPDVERVEVLKGPQGTLFGRNATGGAIRVITRTPSQEFEGKVTLSTGNYDYYSGSAYFAGGLTDTLAANLSVLKKQRDGFANNKTPGANDLDDLDVEMLRSKWLWQANDNFRALISADYTHKEDSQANATVNISEGGVATSDLPPLLAAGNRSGTDLDNVYNGMGTPIETEMFNLQGRLEFQLPGVQLVSITTYQNLDSEVYGDFDASSFVIADLSGEESTESFSQELQLLSDTGGALEWLAGVYWFESEGDMSIALARDTFAAMLAPAPSTAYLPSSDLDTTALAAYGQGTYHLNEQWALTLGGRYSFEEKDARSQTSGPTPSPVVPGVILPKGTPLLKADDDWSEFTPEAIVEYSFDAQLYYLRYARGFKSGGYGYPLNGESVAPEVLDSYELGMKSEWLDNRLRLNTALYYYDYDDLQVNRNANAGTTGPVQLVVETAGTAEIVGLEFDISWLATDQLTFSGGFNAMDTEFVDYDEATANVWDSALPPPFPITTTASFDASGQSLPQAPDFAAYMSMDYVFKLTGATLPLNITYSYKDGYDYDLIAPAGVLSATQTALTEMEGDSVEVWNARLAYVPVYGDWELALWGNNLADEEYYSEVVGFSTGVRASIAAPRTYGAEFSYHF